MEMERWRKFTKSQQIGAIGAEILRAKVWEETDKEKYSQALERAMILIDSSLEDPQWENDRYLQWYLRDEIGKFYVGQNRGIAALYAAI